MLGFLGGLGSLLGKGLGKVFGGDKPKVDPMMAAMLGLSAFGEDGPRGPQSFVQPGANTDPRQALNQALEAVLRVGQGMQGRGPVQLRSSVVQPGPAPVQLKGLPFQIGGGLGRDPALADPSLLQSNRNASITAMDPFQSLAKTTPGGAGPDRAKRREPQQ